jgi:hypothetical protein
MDGGQLFMALAEEAVRHVNEKYGPAAACIAAVTMAALPVAVIAGAVWWFLS